MTLTALESGGLWVPTYYPAVWSIASNLYIVDAAGEKAALILVCPKAGTLDRFDANVGAVANSPDIRFSFQSVDATTGLPSGTLLGATNAAAVTYSSATTGWKSTNFAETVTVTRGQVIACVVDNPGFTATDSISMSHLVTGGTGTFPYGITTVSTKNGANLLIVAPHYTDGYAYVSDMLPGADTVTLASYNSGTTVADEWGLGFQLSVPAKLNRIGVQFSALTAGSDFEVLVYNSSDTVLSTTTWDADSVSGIGAGAADFLLQTELTLAANTTYRVTFRPTTANSIALTYLTFQSAALMQTMAGGDNFYLTSRLNQTGAWTDYNAASPGLRRPRIALHITAIDDAAGGGGGTDRYGMVGG